MTKETNMEGQEKPRLNSKKEMIEFLTNHFRYYDSGNYAHNIKLSRLSLNLSDAAETVAYELIQREDGHEESGVQWVIDEFEKAHNYEYQIGFEGRSGGYITLVKGGRKVSEHKSYCPKCGQRNFKYFMEKPTPESSVSLKVEWIFRIYPKGFEGVYSAAADVLNRLEANELALECPLSQDTVLEIKKAVAKNDSLGRWSSGGCGKCGNPTRINKVFFQTFSSNLNDSNENFSEWEMSDLKDRVEIVWEFDMVCKEALKTFIEFCESVTVEEEEIMVPRKIKVFVEKETVDA